MNNKKILAAICFAVSWTLFPIKFKDFSKFIISAQSNFQTIGAIAPFSKQTAKSIMNSITLKANNLKSRKLMFLEVGPGTGALTKNFVKKMEKMHIDYQLDLVELNSDFCSLLKNKFKENPNVTVYCHDITTWATANKYDVIVSTLPFNTIHFTSHLVNQILLKFESLVNSNGLIFYAEYVMVGKLCKIFLNETERLEYNKKHKILDNFRKKYNTTTNTVFANIPPTYVYKSKVIKESKLHS